VSRLKKAVVPVVLSGIVATGAATEVLKSAPATAGDASTGQSDAVAKAAASTSLTGKAVTAAKAFEASLSASQRSTLNHAFSDASKQTGWSNLPTTFVARNGIKVADLSDAQVAKLKTLLKTILSSQGYKEQDAIRKADTYLSQQPSSGQGPVGNNSTTYGEGLYYVAFYGTPSRSKKWTVQFGGHHLAIHMTFSGAAVSNTPYFVGVEPRTGFTVNGRTYQPLKAKAGALFGAVQSLSAAQQATAKLSQSFDDVLVGPQKDGQFPTAQGITVSTLSKAQQKLVTKAIRAYVADMPAKQAKRRLATYVKQYSKTKLAWSGSTDGTTKGAYARIQGPRVWIEIAVQNGVVLSGTHYHSIERDTKTDYGAGT
jgi:prophage maintenance system killer protein